MTYCDCPRVPRTADGSYLCAKHGKVEGHQWINQVRNLKIRTLRKLADAEGIGWMKIIASTSLDCYECGGEVRKNDEMFLSPVGHLRCSLCTPLPVIRETE